MRACSGRISVVPPQLMVAACGLGKDLSRLPNSRCPSGRVDHAAVKEQRQHCLFHPSAQLTEATTGRARNNETDADSHGATPYSVPYRITLVDVSSGWDHFLAVGYDWLRPVDDPDRSTGLRGKYTQGDFISGHKHFSGPSLAGQYAGRIEFSGPVDDVPAFILHIEIELRVGISPNEFRYSPL